MRLADRSVDSQRHLTKAWDGSKGIVGDNLGAGTESSSTTEAATTSSSTAISLLRENVDFIVRLKSRYVISWKRPPYAAAADIPQPKAVREANALAGVRPPYRFGHAGRVTLPLPLPHDLPMAKAFAANAPNETFLPGSFYHILNTSKRQVQTGRNLLLRDMRIALNHVQNPNHVLIHVPIHVVNCLEAIRGQSPLQQHRIMAFLS